MTSTASTALLLYVAFRPKTRRTGELVFYYTLRVWAEVDSLTAWLPVFLEIIIVADKRPEKPSISLSCQMAFVKNSHLPSPRLILNATALHDGQKVVFFRASITRRLGTQGLLSLVFVLMFFYFILFLNPSLDGCRAYLHWSR